LHVTSVDTMKQNVTLMSR